MHPRSPADTCCKDTIAGSPSAAPSLTTLHRACIMTLCCTYTQLLSMLCNCYCRAEAVGLCRTLGGLAG